MIPMGMGDQEVEIQPAAVRLVGHQSLAQAAQAGAGIQNHEILPAPNFNAGRIAAITHRVRSG